MFSDETTSFGASLVTIFNRKHCKKMKRFILPKR